LLWIGSSGSRRNAASSSHWLSVYPTASAIGLLGRSFDFSVSMNFRRAWRQQRTAEAGEEPARAVGGAALGEVEDLARIAAVAPLAGR
jgi:hypothetical protein